jgi:hypothetical protein
VSMGLGTDRGRRKAVAGAQGAQRRSAAGVRRGGVPRGCGNAERGTRSGERRSGVGWGDGIWKANAGPSPVVEARVPRFAL